MAAAAERYGRSSCEPECLAFLIHHLEITLDA
jgi:hypothetical protein